MAGPVLRVRLPPETGLLPARVLLTLLLTTAREPQWTDLDNAAASQEVKGQIWTALDVPDLPCKQEVWGSIPHAGSQVLSRYGTGPLVLATLACVAVGPHLGHLGVLEAD